MQTQVLGIRSGVDIIEIDRVAQVYRRRPQHFLRRLFTEREQKQLAAYHKPEQHLAARFAAKEAVCKLLGLGIGQLTWTEIEILSLPTGEPQVHLHGRAAARAGELALSSISLSLSHSRRYAVAQAVALSLTKKEDLNFLHAGLDEGQ